ncbi:50S ribosomal protein L23 [Candidatus Roizmanbacteria bacterium RIFOXYB2_FULL_38_10]|uniref:Large ribosomal subunit protein uL23 n=1 Tax=Candidatus Roizmanbacteria bacterium RIFOXYD1_FULL_38_12 TaxID=1802093 RepID=A0A1F7KZR7_9BACT|nr:MAG: 50S ribosomal protein L23 [Candidatus Roizmanbacteria bacterium RIFOXYA2_FULL_38_14]OGK63387.1 MAG: 50S ribosomal protein L23 [Candidatus Roizmanbacteria bacterium RIFOXYA1_FULL_37_12]OGK65233.1 MAG: 50S ribosomal protein L23 [Candidatus Roizmanbacteria bacterium RIFOXYB1_FULL_40_23]OGK68786.1 MAG: 50S ribosomal protein L23 [Candidatus Roizmanbacteria bacterium RIFOXYB2_FULL_38_10]OGK69638.1 MAG: 50S ribosomal protein L23 [Candidatus Roizmanbacteria bacterium RIFOXYC1_FULL_38_14]OGK727
MKINSVIIKPILTEKATSSAQKKIYTFEVNNRSNKHQIQQTVEKMYGVKVSGIQIIVRKGKTKRVGRKMATKQLPDRKIAVISVSEGVINVFPQA